MNCQSHIPSTPSFGLSRMGTTAWLVVLPSLPWGHLLLVLRVMDPYDGRPSPLWPGREETLSWAGGPPSTFDGRPRWIVIPPGPSCVLVLRKALLNAWDPRKGDVVGGRDRRKRQGKSGSHHQGKMEGKQRTQGRSSPSDGTSTQEELGTTAQLKRDPYEVLGVQRDANEQEIRTAYRKLALLLHPDKAGPERAQEFHEVRTAYAILSDEEKRKAYDKKGFDGLDAEDLVFEVDLSSMGAVNTAMAAMFSKLGAPIKTTLPPELLDEIGTGSFQTRKIQLEQKFHGRVDKQKCAYFAVELSDEQARAGIVVLVSSESKSRFKLLHCEKVGPHDYEIADKVDSEKLRGVTAAGMFFVDAKTYMLGGTPPAIEQAKYEVPEDFLFRRLDSMKPRENKKLASGQHVFAVYGDNWFQKTVFSITVRSLLEEPVLDTLRSIVSIEEDLSAMKSSLGAFEESYKQAQKRYIDACERYDIEAARLQELTENREKAYTALRATGSEAEAGATSTPRREATVDVKRGEINIRIPGLGFNKLFKDRRGSKKSRPG